MDQNSLKQTGPLQNLYIDIKKIIDNIETKNLEEANKYETDEISFHAQMWMGAQIKDDRYTTYSEYWTKEMFKEVQNNITERDFQALKAKPFSVPLKYRDVLLEKGREAFLSQYEEKNDYYRMLIGLPPIGTTSDQYVKLSPELQEKFHVGDDPVHLLPSYVQNMYMNTDEYKSHIVDPKKAYLKYIGNNKVDLYTARNAKDFDIIRYPTNRSDINPNLLNIFASLYADYREYVMVVLYNKQLEDVYAGYRPFMGMLIMSFTLFQIGNKALESINDRKYLDDTILHITLSMYGIPDTLLMTKDTRRHLAINILKLIKEKGTSEVYYDLIDILGYQDVAISKLMLMKGQKFDIVGKALDDYEPYFLQLDLKDEDPYKTIVSGKAATYSVEEITANDPSWWQNFDDPDDPVTKLLKTKEYTQAESKYIVIEATIHQMKYMFESIYFAKMILDNKSNTDNFLFEIPDLLGTQKISVFDAILAIICTMCMSNGMTGEFNTNDNDLLAAAGFNFDINIELFDEFLETTSYVDKDKIRNFINALTITNESDIARVFNDVIYPMREWLENKIVSTTNRKEYTEYEAIYKSLFTYDLTRNVILDDFEMPIETIRKKYGISEADMEAFKHFYPRTMTGESVKVTEYNESTNSSRYRYPFLTLNNEITWHEHISFNTVENRMDDRGELYFHDILNCNDCRELTGLNSGQRIFMNYESDDGWTVDKQAVEKAKSLIDNLPDDELATAFFQIYTPVLNSNGKYFEEGERLPASIRSSGVFKDILKDKIDMDIQGLSEPPKTYFEFLQRKNPTLFNFFCDYSRLRDEKSKDIWRNDIMTLIMTLESELSIHMKYLEQAVVGKELFFKPLVTLINHFKSMLVSIAKTGITYVFDDKMDIGGNSNMLKFFDDMKFVVQFSTFSISGYDSEFGLFDTEHKSVFRAILKDRCESITETIGEGFAAEQKTTHMGSIRMSDEMKFFKNGEPVDPTGHESMWYSGEPGTGRWSNEDDVLMKTRTGTVRVQNAPVDTEGWKDYVESYNPIE